jgi:chromosome partitioning protein
MGKVITVMNMKGGVGKTTITAHIGSVIAGYKLLGKTRRVLLIDYDPQFNLSQAYIPAEKYFDLEENKRTIMAALLEDDEEINPFHLQVPGNESPPSVDDVKHNIFSADDGRCLDIIPSTLDLMFLAVGHFDKSTKIIEERFRKFIEQCKEKYDIIMIDCHPAGSLFTKTSLVNSEHVLIPVAPQAYALRGIALMMQFIKGKKVGFVGAKPHIIFNMTKRNETSKEENEIRTNDRYGKYCLVGKINQYSVMKDLVGGSGFIWQSKKAYSNEALSKLRAAAVELLMHVEN